MESRRPPGADGWSRREQLALTRARRAPRPDVGRPEAGGGLARFVVFAMLAMIVVVAVVNVEVHEPTLDAFTVATFFPTILVSALALSRESVRRPYSLHQMHLVYVFLAFGMVPLIEYLTWNAPWSKGGAPIQIDAFDYTITNAIVSSWLGFYLFFHWLKRDRPVDDRPPRGVFGRTLTTKGLVVAVFGSIAALVVLGVSGSFLALTRAAGRRVRVLENGRVLNEVATIFSMAMPFVTLGAMLLVRARLPARRRGRMTFAIVVVAVGVALFDNPLAFSRFWTGTTLIGLFVAGYLHRRPRSPWFIPGALVAIMLGMPFLNQARNIEEVDAYTQRPIGDVQEYTGSGDYDSFTTFFYLRRLIEDPSQITWGRQLLGVLLFWVPRPLWPQKPIGSGAHIARHFGFTFTNILAPSLPAEGIINFGWVGVPLFAWAFAGIVRRADDSYAACRLGRGPVTMLEVVYCFYLGLVLFVSRGDLMSGAVYVTAFTVAALPLWLLSAPAARPGRA